MNASLPLRTSFQRVTKRRPCKLCGKCHGCVYDPRRGLIICMRISSDRRVDRWSGWLHHTEPTLDEVDEHACIHETLERKPLTLEEAGQRDRLYAQMAAHPFCRLTTRDRADLHRRGLDDIAIAWHGLFTYPDRSGLSQVTRDLRSWAEANDLLYAFWNLPGVSTVDRPGGTGYRDRLMRADSQGHGAVAIPTRDSDGRTIAVHLRRRTEEMPLGGDGKYKWLSSQLAPSGAPVHIARPTVLRDTSRVVITEGHLKGIIAAERLGCLVVCAPGITILGGIIAALGRLQTRGDITRQTRVAIAFDEQPDNPRVAEQRDKLATLLGRQGWGATLLRWDAAVGKGIDDVLVASGSMREEHPTPRAELRAEPKGQALYPLLTDTEVEALKPAQGILGDLLFEDTIAYLYGDSDTWKTFVALSWGLAIATGRPWLGRSVRQGPVVYVASEGARGIGKRVAAWKRQHAINYSTDLVIVPLPINLLDTRSMPRLIASIRAHSRLAGTLPAAIVFDTLARSMDGGDENGTLEANRVTAAAGVLKAEYGCCVLILHHSGKDAGRGMRGNSALRNNADIVIRTIAPTLGEGQHRETGDVVTLRSGKAKDTEPFADVYVTTQRQEWTTDDGESVNSLVIVATDTPVATQSPQLTLPKSSRTALDVLAAAAAPLTSSQWHHATGLARRTFYDAHTDLTKRQYVSKDREGKGACYHVSETGWEEVSADVRERCQTDAGALTAAERDSAAAAHGLYTDAPPHQADLLEEVGEWTA